MMIIIKTQQKVQN